MTGSFGIFWGGFPVLLAFLFSFFLKSVSRSKDSEFLLCSWLWRSVFLDFLGFSGFYNSGFHLGVYFKIYYCC